MVSSMTIRMSKAVGFKFSSAKHIDKNLLRKQFRKDTKHNIMPIHIKFAVTLPTRCHLSSGHVSA